MRKLNTSDVFAFTRLVKEIGLKEEIKNITAKVSEETDVKALGIDIIFTLIEKFSEVNSENALYEFLSRPLEISKEEVGTMDLFDLVEKIMQIADVEKWKTFLKLAIR
jgi:ATP-dependent RNA circularization protein (DNA/RNA ligase family)